MRASSYLSILKGVATRTGLDPEKNLNRNVAAAMAEYLTDAVRVCWEFYPWPETVTVESRTPVSQIIGYQQAGENAIGEVMSVSVRHPETDNQPGFIPFGLNADGIIVPASVATAVYVRYRKPSPEFTASDYAAATAYAVDDLVYYGTTGDCYRCIQAGTGNEPTDTDFWELQQIPRILDRAIREGAYTLQLREEGQIGTAVLPNQAMESLLIQQVDLLQRQQNQPGYFNVAAPPAHIATY